MRILSYILMAAAILLLANAGYDEFRGVTHAPSMGRRYSVSSREIIRKESDPGNFHNAMVYHWFYAMMLFLGAVIAFVIDRGQERVDPLSPDADEKIGEELREDELEMKKEKEKRPE
jgi:hypothetical protein